MGGMVRAASPDRHYGVFPPDLPGENRCCPLRVWRGRRRDRESRGGRARAIPGGATCSVFLLSVTNAFNNAL